MLASTLSGVIVREAHGEEVLVARRLHATRYLAEGYIDHVGTHGVIDDEYSPHSTYYVAIHERTGEIIGTCRLIDSETHAFPMLDHMELDPEWRRFLLETPSSEIGEVSSLVTTRSDLAHFAISAALCREAFQLSLTERHRQYLLCVVDRRFLRVLNGVFRLGLVPAGPAQDYMGATIPTVGLVQQFLLDIRERNDPLAEYFAEHLDVDALADAVIDLRGERAVLLPAPAATRGAENHRVTA